MHFTIQRSSEYFIQHNIFFFLIHSFPQYKSIDIVHFAKSKIKIILFALDMSLFSLSLYLLIKHIIDLSSYDAEKENQEGVCVWVVVARIICATVTACMHHNLNCMQKCIHFYWYGKFVLEKKNQILLFLYFSIFPILLCEWSRIKANNIVTLLHVEVCQYACLCELYPEICDWYSCVCVCVCVVMFAPETVRIILLPDAH